MGIRDGDRGLAQEIAAIGMLLAGVLLLLALVSFDPRDYGHFTQPANAVPANFIGPVGAFFAGLFVYGFGLAAGLLPVLLMAGGLALIFCPPVNYGWKVLWLGLVLLSGAPLLQVLDPFSWHFEGIDYAGGMVGYFVHERWLEPVVGRAGSILVLAFVYLTSLVLLFEVRPVEMSVALVKWVRETWEGWQQRRLENADPMERLRMEQRRIEKEAEKLRREQKKIERRQGFKRADPQEAPEPAAVERPAPRVIDTLAGETSDKTEEKKTAGTDAERPARRAGKERAGEAVPPPAAPAGAAVAKAAPAREHRLPGVELLLVNEGRGAGVAGGDELKRNMELIVETLRQFRIDVQAGDITRGATITRYEVYPGEGVRVERVAGMQKDIARAMSAESVHILAPIPGKDTVGIEVANRDKAPVLLRDLLESEPWKTTKARLPLALGKDVYGKVLVADLAEMPHVLIGGSTGSGKSVCMNCLLMSLLFRFHPDDLKLILVDPKVVELQVYNDLPHLVVPVVTETKKVLTALRWVINEMEKRYRILAQAGVRNIMAYNARMAERAGAAPENLNLESSLKDSEGGGSLLPGMGTAGGDVEQPRKLPYIVVVIDELADLMQTAPADVELAIARLSAKARAAGIHLVIATQTPRAAVVTGVIKTNIPCRISFKVPSALDSRVILDENGAENLMGKGDLLYLPPGGSKLVRAQGAFISDEEVTRVVDMLKGQGGPAFHPEIHQKLSRPGGSDESELTEDKMDQMRKAIEVALQERKLSTSLVQRRLKVGYNTAADLVDLLVKHGILAPAEGARPRELLVDPDQFDIDHFMESL